jgi:anti-anti-sigma regulatory factor
MPIPESSIEVAEHEGVIVLAIHGYFNDETGARLDKIVETMALINKNRFIIDFRDCPLINSLGISILLDVTMKVIDDFHGNMVLTGLDAGKTRVMEEFYIIPTATVAATLAEALLLVRE